MEFLIIEIDLNKLEQKGISANEYTLLYLLFKGLTVPDRYKPYLEGLEALEWLKIGENSITLLNKATQFLNVKALTNDVESWIDEWTALWPSGVKNSGKAVKSDRVSNLNKMAKFVKIYKNYTKEQIMEATKYYLENRQRNGWGYTMVAHYFILKEGISALAAEIDNLTNMEQKYEFYKSI